MNKNKKILRHPLEDSAEVLWTLMLGAVGQLLLSWLLSKAAESAERRDLQSGDGGRHGLLQHATSPVAVVPINSR